MNNKDTTQHRMAELMAPISQIKIISHKEKDDWELVAKYNIGRRK